MIFENCLFIGPEHCGRPAEIIGRTIIKLQENDIELSTEQLEWLEQCKRISDYKESLMARKELK